MPPKHTDSVRKRRTQASKKKYKEENKCIYIRNHTHDRIQGIASKEKMSIRDVVVMLIELYEKQDQMTRRAHMTSTPLAKTPPGPQTPRSVDSLPFFQSPLVPRCNRTVAHQEEDSSAVESDVMSGVHKIAPSDEETGQPSKSVSATEDIQDVSEFNASVECITVGDYVYPQEQLEEVDDDDDQIWHPSHYHNKQLCQNLTKIDTVQEVFGVLEEEEEPEHEPEHVSEPELLSTHSGLHRKESQATHATHNKLFVATESMIIELARKLPCGTCGASTTVAIVPSGTAGHITWTCDTGHTSRLCTQETINGSHVGDIKLASAILLSGNNFHKVKRMADFMNLHMFSSRLFLAVQNNYVCPVVDAEFGNIVTNNLDKHKDKDIVVCGDARNDSPGFSAQYCTYTLLEHDSKDIVDVQFVDKRETGDKSPNMEPAALLRALEAIKSGGVKVKEVVTDAHPTISALLRREYTDLLHSWDVWHGAKNIGKKISQSAATAATKPLRFWTKHIVTHFWHCAETCGGDENLFLSKWRGLVHHVTNKHEWAITGGLGGVAHCEHDELPDREEWLSSGTRAHDALVKIVMDRKFLSTIVRFVNFRHTGELESLHSHILMYCGKRFAFGYRAYRVRNLLAMIDYSRHKDRALMVDDQGNPKCRSKWSKHAGDWIVYHLRVPKPYAYIPAVMEEILRRRLCDSRPLFRPADPLPNDPREIRPRLAPVSPPPMADLLQRRKSRFSK